MKTTIQIIAALLMAAGLRAANLPLENAYLRTELNANAKSVTNLATLQVGSIIPLGAVVSITNLQVDTINGITPSTIITGGQTVAYATGSGNADTLSGLNSTSFWRTNSATISIPSSPSPDEPGLVIGAAGTESYSSSKPIIFINGHGDECSLAADSYGLRLPNNTRIGSGGTGAVWAGYLYGYNPATAEPLLDMTVGPTSGDYNIGIAAGSSFCSNFVFEGVNVGIQTDSPSERLHVNGNAAIQSNLTVFGSAVNFANLPTSTNDLSAGDLWNDGGTLKIKQ